MKRAITLVALFAAGCAAALTLGAGRASAYTPDQLPGLGYSTSVLHLANGCNEWAAGYGTAPRQDLGSDCDAGFQARLDAFVAATCPCAQTTTTAATAASPSPSTSTPSATTTDTTPPPPATTTAAAAPSPTVTETATSTVTVTLSSTEQSLSDRIDALSAQIAALTDRVSRIERASDAAWLAFEQAVAGGADPAAAADIARGTYLNAVYGLGAFGSGSTP